MSRRAVEDLLLTRYADDWAYQANVRGQMANLLGSLPGEGDYGKLDGKREPAKARTAEMLKLFLRQNLCFPVSPELEDVQVDFPWNRMFECDVKAIRTPEKNKK